MKGLRRKKELWQKSIAGLLKEKGKRTLFPSKHCEVSIRRMESSEYPYNNDFLNPAIWNNMASRYADSGGEKRGTGDSEYSEMGKKAIIFIFIGIGKEILKGRKL